MKIKTIIEEFGNSMGMEGLALNRDGCLCLEFQEMGTLHMELTGERLLISLGRDLSPHDTDIFERALELCHFKHGHPLPVHAGCQKENRLLFMVKVPDRDLTLPLLEQILQTLNHCHTRVIAPRI
jgi:type III secretion system chaperone SycN